MRRGIIEFLSFLGTAWPKVYAGFLRELLIALRSTGDTQLVDLCAGAAGPSRLLKNQLADSGLQIELCFSDLHPESLEKLQLGPGESRSELAVDARNVPSQLDGFRIMINGFHHFREADAQAIIQDAINKRQGIAIFEGITPTIPSLIALLSSPLTVWLVTFMIKPRTWWRFLFTYFIPLIPLLVLWDGLGSWFRMYSLEQWQKMTEVPGGSDFDWIIRQEKIQGTPATVRFMIGRPKTPNASQKSPPL